MKEAGKISKLARQVIYREFLPLEGVREGLGARIVRFIGGGDAGDVLTDLEGLSGIEKTFPLWTWSGWTLKEGELVFLGLEPGSARKELYNVLASAPSALFRLGQVLWALARGRTLRPLPDLLPGRPWLALLLTEAYESDFTGPGVTPKGWTLALIEEIVVASGLPRDAFFRSLLFRDRPGPLLRCFKRYQDCFQRHKDLVREALTQSSQSDRFEILTILLVGEIDIQPFAKEIGAASVSNCQKERQVAIALAKSCGCEGITKEIRALAADKKSRVREQAVEALWLVEGDSAKSFLRTRLELERSLKVRRRIQEVFGGTSTKQEPVKLLKDDGEMVFNFEPIAVPKEHAPLGDETYFALWKAVQDSTRAAQTLHEREWDRTDSRYRSGSRDLERMASEDQVRQVFVYLQSGKDGEKVHGILEPPRSYQDGVWNALHTFCARGELKLVHLLRLLNALGVWGASHSHYGSEHVAHFLMNYKLDHCPELDLRVLAAALKAAGLSKSLVVGLYLSAEWEAASNPLDLEDHGIWPFFAENLELLEVALGMKLAHEVSELKEVPAHHRDRGLAKLLTELEVGEFGDPSIGRGRALAILALFPKVPPVFTSFLWDLALGTKKRWRPSAQSCLARYPGKETRIIAGLESTKSGVRAVAAKWLGRLVAHEAKSALLAAYKTERASLPKAEMINALEAVGVPLDQFLNRQGLLAEAEFGLKKALPKGIVWFPWEDLPIVTWEKSRRKVSPKVLKWFLVEAFRLRTPKPSALLRRYCSLFRSEDREALGAMVFEAWLASDRRPSFSYDQALAQASQEMKLEKLKTDRGSDSRIPWNEEDHQEGILRRFLKQTSTGSAASNKGILAVVAACAGPGIVPIAERYLRKWYGQKMAQCKALLQMLSWLDHAEAIQVLVSVSHRFRTLSLQKEAANLVTALASRKGWTSEELADRTIPRGGFGEEGFLSVDYGTRKFRVHLVKDLSLVISSEEGQILKSLPRATNKNDRERVQKARKMFSARKKEIQKVLKLQKERLYESMCVGREWSFVDWNLQLNQHPLVGRLCQSLVWQAVSSTGEVKIFRPTEDGMFKGVNNEFCELDQRDMINLAHGSIVSEEDSRRWIGCFSNEKIVPLFEQFNPGLDLSIKRKQTTEFLDFEGYLVPAFQLRNHLVAQGYTQGEIEDGGMFYTYSKRFPGLKIQALIEISGGRKPLENRPIALLRLSFERVQADDDRRSFHNRRASIPLGQVPPILLSECWTNYKKAAELGPGFDKDWMTTVYIDSV